MLNPDGVANGHYRMDVFNQNLNRHYKNPDLRKQPVCYAIKELVTYLHAGRKTVFFIVIYTLMQPKKGASSLEML